MSGLGFLLLKPHHRGNESGILLDRDHVFGHFVHTSAMVKTMKGLQRPPVVIHFDQRNEQSSTDTGKKDRQNLSGAGPAGRPIVCEVYALLRLSVTALDLGRFGGSRADTRWMPTIKEPGSWK